MAIPSLLSETSPASPPRVHRIFGEGEPPGVAGDIRYEGRECPLPQPRKRLMAYEIKQLPFRTDMSCVAAINSETGKVCKFMVYFGADLATNSVGIRSGLYLVRDTSVFIDSRSPTPGFPAPDEMSEEEVNNEFDAMTKAICEAL